MDVCVWINDPDFVVVKKVTFTSMATDNQEWLLILPDTSLATVDVHKDFFG